MRLARREDSCLDHGERGGLLHFWNLGDVVFENIYLHTIIIYNSGRVPYSFTNSGEWG